MLFSSITFLYYFLPVVLFLYFIFPKKGRNLVLLISSAVFYAWGEPKYVFLMFFSILSGWVFGFYIEKYRGTKKSKLFMVVSVSINMGLLVLFKYADFFIETLNWVLQKSSLSMDASIPLLKLALPIGISFYTFQIISYTIDLYYNRMKPQKNIITFAAYVALFPQLIAGPIVRYLTVEQELKHRENRISDLSEGVIRFTIGLGKKVLLANVMGEICELYKSGTENSVLFAWMYVIGFSYQIYFDFSGYSDMAIGLGKIFGFHFPENFIYPYEAKSITEFFRRWHISLGTWFRDYVYIPLGGNRVRLSRKVINILIVWMLTGLWHGAGFNFILWGLYFGIWMLAEKYVFAGFSAKLPNALKHFFTLVLIFFGWVLFDAESGSQALWQIGNLFGFYTEALFGQQSVYYLKSYMIPFILAMIGATHYPKMVIQKIMNRKAGEYLIRGIQPLFIAALMIMITAYLIDSSFNPFIYFRF